MVEVVAVEEREYAQWVEKDSSASLFHLPAWIDFICREQGGVPRIYKVFRNGEHFGYWPLVLIEKGPFRLLGSPLRGWLTTQMGPLLRGTAEPGLICALKRVCLKERIAYLEASGEALSDDLMLPFGFSVRTAETWILDVASSYADQWAKLHHNCKKNIRKAERSGIEIRRLEDNSYLRHLYDLVVATFRAKKVAVPFRYRRLELLQDTIGKAGRLLFLGAFHGGEFVGGHIWGHDRKTAYAFVSASRPEFDPYRVNNLLIWEGIKSFIDMGLTTYDMSGGGRKNEGVARFKASFGSVYQTRPHFAISFSKIFSSVLNFYEKWYLAWKRHPAHL